MKPLTFAALICGSVVGLIILPIISTVVGAFCGWVVGWFFDDTILGIARQIGIDGIAMWQIGAFLGFVSGFFCRPGRVKAAS